MKSSATDTLTKIKPAPQARRRGKRRAVAGLVGLTLVVAAGGAIFGVAQSLNAKSSTTTSLDAYRVSRGSFEIVVTASGELQAEKQTEIRSQLESAADIVEILEEGVQAKKGELLLHLNDEAIRRNIEDQILNVESARNDLIASENDLAIQINENDAAIRQAKLKVELAEIDLKKWEEGDAVKQRRELELAIEKAKLDKDRLVEKYERSVMLHEKGFLSNDELQSDMINKIQSEATLERAEKDLWLYETYQYDRDRKQKTSDLEEASAALERAERLNESRLANKEANVTNRRRQLAIREDRLKVLNEQLAACTIEAPTSGLVVYATSFSDRRGSDEQPLQIGRTIRPNEFLIALPDTSSMIASVRVHESIAGRIHFGQRATVRVDAIRGETYTGVVKSVGVLAETGGWRDPNLREYTVKILLDGGNPGQKLKPSMRADAEIIIGQAEDVIAVPVQSIFHEGEVSYVYTPKAGKYAKTPVRIGQRSSTTAEVLAGLPVGETVLLREPAPGEIVSRDIDPVALAAIAPSPEEIAAAEAAAREQAARLAAVNSPPHEEIDVEAMRNNPNLPEQLRERMKTMTDDQIREMAKRSSGGSGPGGQQGNRPQRGGARVGS